MLDFHSKEIKSKVLSKYTQDLCISLLIYKIEVGSKLGKKLMIIQPQLCIGVRPPPQ